jgi:hypothetical protein
VEKSPLSVFVYYALKGGFAMDGFDQALPVECESSKKAIKAFKEFDLPKDIYREFFKLGLCKAKCTRNPNTRELKIWVDNGRKIYLFIEWEYYKVCPKTKERMGKGRQLDLYDLDNYYAGHPLKKIYL